VGEDVTVGSRDEVHVAGTLAADIGNSIATLAACTSLPVGGNVVLFSSSQEPEKGHVFCCYLQTKTSKFNICNVTFPVYLLSLYKHMKWCKLYERLNGVLDVEHK
jgi:hypothetical protein